MRAMGSATRLGGIWCAVVLPLAVGAGACGKKKEGGGESGSKVNEAQAARAGASGDEARHGGHLVLPSNEPRYLNPILETRFSRAGAFVFEGLVGLSSALEPVPVLAESWDQSKDGKRITFRLRDGVKWQDGKPLTADDVKFTFDAI